MSIAALLPALALATVPPPPVPGEPMLLAWTAGDMTCGDRTVSPAIARRPELALVWPGVTAAPMTLRFAIDADGRAIDIARDGDAPAPFSDDVAPALAANRFAPGAPQSGCRVTFAPQRLPMAQAPVGDLISYTLDRRYGDLPRSGWDRITPPGTCTDEPRPMPLVRVMPDFEQLPGTPGAREWSMIGYDTDARGKPVNVRVIEGTRSATLDAASVKAIRESRFTGNARTGCLYPYWRGAVPLHAPEQALDEAMLHPAGATCPASHGWATPPRLSFPEPWRRRGIEGWAVLAYDVAPWGEIGNVRVLAAQPAAAFGTEAIGVLKSAKLPASATGLTGCVDRIRFVMGKRGDPAAVPAAAGITPPF